MQRKYVVQQSYVNMPWSTTLSFGHFWQSRQYLFRDPDRLGEDGADVDEGTWKGQEGLQKADTERMQRKRLGDKRKEKKAQGQKKWPS
jgi:hypothetical protein